MRTRTRVTMASAGKDSLFLDSGIRIDTDSGPFSVEEPLSRFTTENKFCKKYEYIVDAIEKFDYDYWLGYSAKYRGKHPKPRVFRTKRKVNYGRLYSMHPCIHLKKQYGANGSMGIALTGPLKTGDYYSGFPGIHFYWRAEPTIHLLDPDFLRAYLPDVTQDDQSCFISYTDVGAEYLGALRRKALRENLPDMEAGFSLPVFLGEFRDIPRMFKSLFKGLSKFGTFLGNLGSKPVQTLSRLQLSGSFGWLPFVSDIKTLINRILYLRDDVTKFIKEANERRTYHYHEELDAHDLRPDEWFDKATYPVTINCQSMSPSNPLYPLRRWFKSISFKVEVQNVVENFVYHATTEFSYSLPDNGRWTALLVALDRFGMNMSPSDIWELIPFSFVVDWFFSVQSVLEQFDDTNCPAQVVISRFCDSIHFDHKRTFNVVDVSYVVQDDGYIPPAYDGFWAVTPVYPDSLEYKEEGYYRWAGIPPVHQEDFPGLTLPHGMQIVNLLALGGSRG